MASLTGFKRHYAFFFDRSGQYVGRKNFKNSFFPGIKEKIFNFRDGAYNIKPFASRVKFSSLLSDKFFYIYDIENPDPLFVSNGFIPMMSPRTYNDLLESNLINDLNKSRRDPLKKFLNPKMLIIALVVICGLVYFLSGGSLT